MTAYKVKFFGSKTYKGQIKQVKMEIEARSASEVEELLYHKFGYQTINGLKIR